MPKKIVTSKTIPVMLHELDKWQGKLSWSLYCDRVAKVLGEKSVGRHTLIQYEVIKSAFDKRKEALKNDTESDTPCNATVEMLMDENKMLKAKVERLEEKEKAYKEQFVRWLENIRLMPGVDLTRLANQLDKPLPKVDRK
jgi:predicted RNase H-like nuclease (RuvC/YqgF family)